MLSAVFARPAALTKEALVLVRDAILDALVVLDGLAAEGRLPDGIVVELLRALKMLVQCCGPALEKPTGSTVVRRSTELTILESLNKFRAAARSIYCADPVETEADDGQNYHDEPTPEEAATDDFRLIVVVQILERCGYFLAHSALGLGALNIVVEIIGSGLACLAANRNVLLPTV